MNLVKVETSSIMEMKNKFKENNNIILDNIKIINSELKNISNILNTPKSTKTIPRFIKHCDTQEKKIMDKDLLFEKNFNMLLEEYNNFLNEVHNMVGENNE